MTLISEAHRERYARHYADRTPASKPSQWVEPVRILARTLGARTVLDYGCGNARGLSPYLDLTVQDYDPAIPGINGPPLPADLVVCIHTLEHVEASKVDAVLADIERLALRACLVVASCEPSTKLLPDGTAWHSFVRTANWWAQRLSRYEPFPTLKAKGLEYAALLVKA